ncbi:glycosyltransferase [bacterium]|nr:glycosyltransferase [bacterium]
MRKRLLYLVHGFPPYRTEPNTAHLIKYLGRQGWDVDVIHRHPGWGYNKFALYHDTQLLEELPENVVRYPVTINLWLGGLKGLLKGKKTGKGSTSWPGSKPPKSFIKRLYRSLRQIPDNRVNILRPALLRAVELIRKHEYDCLITSAPPFSVHLTGCLIKAITGIPWVCHSRDLFRYYPLYKAALPWRIRADRLLEKEIISRADIVTTVYPEATAWLKDRYGKSHQKYFTVRNGYDEEDFQQPLPAAYKKFTLLHPGRLAADESSGRTGYALLDGMRLWLERRPELKDKVQLELIGSIDPIYPEEIKQRNLEGCVNIRPPLPVKEVIAHEQIADLLLIIIEDDTLIEFTAGGKIYECARAGKPTLGILSEDNAAAKLIHRLKLGQVAQYGDGEDVSRKLEAMYDEITSGNLRYGGAERDHFVENTSYEKLAERFDEILTEQLGR